MQGSVCERNDASPLQSNRHETFNFSIQLPLFLLFLTMLRVGACGHGLSSSAEDEEQQANCLGEFIGEMLSPEEMKQKFVI